jgi:hypothetical protein
MTAESEMNEEEWLASVDPVPMLDFLNGGASDRKLRLFACSCCRRVWSHLSDDRSREAMETSERYGEGKATDQELLQSHDEAETASEMMENAFRQGGIDSKTVSAAVAVSRGVAIGESMKRVNAHDWWFIFRGSGCYSRCQSRCQIRGAGECGCESIVLRCNSQRGVRPASRTHPLHFRQLFPTHADQRESCARLEWRPHHEADPSRL